MNHRDAKGHLRPELWFVSDRGRHCCRWISSASAGIANSRVLNQVHNENLELQEPEARR